MYIDFESLKLPDECGPTISDQAKQHCRNKRSMITPETWTPVLLLDFDYTNYFFILDIIIVIVDLMHVRIFIEHLCS